MTKDETAKLLAVMTATYPNLHFDDKSLALETWWRILEPDDGQQIMDAFSVYARTDASGFAPSPGKLHSMVESRMDPEMTEGEIIGLLTKASHNSIYGAEEEFRQLPELLQKAVGSPAIIRSWGTMEPDQLDYAFNRIIKAYRTWETRSREDKAAIGSSLSVEALSRRIVDKLNQNVLPFHEDDYELTRDW